MRHSKAIVAAGNLRTRALGFRRTIVLALLLIVVAWIGIAFAQEAYLSHKLSQQVADLRKQNALLAAQNQGYHKDVQAITTGTANEEEARLNGYARPQERVYLVTTPPSPSPSPPPATSPTPASPSPR
jgi:cell division protein FtsB